MKNLFSQHLQLEVPEVSITKSSAHYISDSSIQSFNETICYSFEKVVKDALPPVG